jgi:hypothetical protein
LREKCLAFLYFWSQRASRVSSCSVVKSISHSRFS